MEREMCNKLTQIREILESTNEPGKGTDSGHTIGIVSALEEKNVKWLRTALSAKYFSGLVKKVTFLSVSDMKGSKLEKSISKFTLCIYVTNDRKWKSGISASETELLPILGSKNLIFVIDDHDDSSDEAKTQILMSQPIIERYARGLFLFSKLEKQSDYQKLLSSDRGSFADSSRQGSTRKKLKIGLFSRSEERDYSWLVKLLTSEDFKDHCLDVRTFHISKNRFQQFTKEVSICTYGILYHTKNRGRVNVTDVTDSLYDDELKYLWTVLGKDNVIVVIDDLIDSSDQEKTRILQAQPSIAAWADELILITHKEKTEEMGQQAKMKFLRIFLRLELRIEIHRLPLSTGIRKQSAPSLHPPMERTPSQSQDVTPMQSSSGILMAKAMPSRSTIGIFSRSEESDYSWLRRLLTAGDSGSREVRCCKISGYDDDTFREAAFQCKFGILYHTIKSGKIRITDVEKSLYHEELEKLSAKLGKRKLIVVIDDLDDSSDDLKSTILKKQPSIGRLAGDIFLFTAKEKKYLDGQEKQAKKTPKKSTSDKIQRIREILNLVKTDISL
ncbi:uncharacterized protein LOC134945683 [Pseudophryne corroboree]|uniref:uncharacterized protein LOC134945683 n=1 Tax=Pseudophryne corroboree TaxID=495146 RepID=UPI0030820FFD